MIIQNVACQTEIQTFVVEAARPCQEAAQLRLKEIFPLADIHGTIQHPCWIMSPINKLTGDGIDDVSVERCRTGVQAIGGDCKWGPVRKPTVLKATSTWITQKLSVECQCLVPPHVQMTSLPTAPGHAELKPSFAKLAAAAIQQARRGAAHHGGRTSCPAWPARCASPPSKTSLAKLVARLYPHLPSFIDRCGILGEIAYKKQFDPPSSASRHCRQLTNTNTQCVSARSCVFKHCFQPGALAFFFLLDSFFVRWKGAVFIAIMLVMLT